jgi:tetratricopeptide repeat protein
MTTTCCACGKSVPDESAFCPECGEKRGADARLLQRAPALAVVPVSDAGKEASLHALRLASRASVDALLARANLLRMRGQWTDAVELCTEALRVDAHSPAAHSLLGDIYENQGRLDKAIRWYQLALDLDPESVADQAKLTRARELQAVRRRTGSPRLSWAYLVAVAGVAFLFVAFVMAALVAGDKRSVISPLAVGPLPPYPQAIIPKVMPPDHTTEEDDLRKALADDLHSPIMYVAAVTLDPLTPAALVRVHLGDRAITPDPMGGGRRGRILRDGYRIAELADQYCRARHRDLRFVTISALSKLSSGGGAGPTVPVWQGRIDVTRLGAGDDKATPTEVEKVFEKTYWNPIAGF